MPTEAVTIAMIKDAIKQRHGGSTANIVLYRGAVSDSDEARCPIPLTAARWESSQAKEDNSLERVDDGATIQELGVKGVAPGEVYDDRHSFVLLFSYLDLQPFH